jgi:site-specific recombinase XerD
VQRQGRKIEKDTKTHQMRRISLDKDTIAVLEEHRDRAQHRAKLLDVACIDEWYLFFSDPAYGRPWNPDWVTHRYTDMAADQGISTHLHELRHYSATELLSAGVDLATVSGRLGHGGGGATTLRVYAAWVAASTNVQPRYSAPQSQHGGHNSPNVRLNPARRAKHPAQRQRSRVGVCGYLVVRRRVRW